MQQMDTDMDGRAASMEFAGKMRPKRKLWSDLRLNIRRNTWTKVSTSQYDKQFLVRLPSNKGTTLCSYTPLVPSVVTAYKKDLSDMLMAYMDQQEALEVCQSPNTTNDTRGRLFELMTIRRCHANGVQGTSLVVKQWRR